MTAAARKLEERKDEIETLLALDTGNALRTQAKPETAASIELTHMFAGLAGEIKGENYPPNIPNTIHYTTCLLYTSPSPRDRQKSRMPSSA